MNKNIFEGSQVEPHIFNFNFSINIVGKMWMPKDGESYPWLIPKIKKELSTVSKLVINLEYISTLGISFLIRIMQFFKSRVILWECDYDDEDMIDTALLLKEEQNLPIFIVIKYPKGSEVIVKNSKDPLSINIKSISDIMKMIQMLEVTLKDLSEYYDGIKITTPKGFPYSEAVKSLKKKLKLKGFKILK